MSIRPDPLLVYKAPEAGPGVGGSTRKAGFLMTCCWSRFRVCDWLLDDEKKHQLSMKRNGNLLTTGELERQHGSVKELGRKTGGGHAL
jgi:hypothetical protein